MRKKTGFRVRIERMKVGGRIKLANTPENYLDANRTTQRVRLASRCEKTFSLRQTRKTLTIARNT